MPKLICPVKGRCGAKDAAGCCHKEGVCQSLITHDCNVILKSLKK
jgi:hypothetical protein